MALYQNSLSVLLTVLSVGLWCWVVILFFPLYNLLLSGLGKASNISAVGTIQSMTVEWKPPAGIVTLYNVKILFNGTVLKMENRTNASTVVFSDLLPGTLYNVIVTSNSGPIKQDSDSVSNATCKTPHTPQNKHTHLELFTYKHYTQIKHTLRSVSKYADLHAVWVWEKEEDICFQKQRAD